MKNIKIELKGEKENAKLFINNVEFTEQEINDLMAELKNQLTMLKAEKNNFIFYS